MKLTDYIDHEFIPLKKEQGDFSNQDFIWTHYPIVNENNELISVITDEDIFDFSSYKLIDTNLIIHSGLHPLECIRQMKHFDSNILFIVENGQYIGAVSFRSIMDYIKNNYDLPYEYSILILKIKQNQYSLSDLSRITESEGIRMSSFQLKYLDYNHQVEITLVLDSTNLKTLVGVLENKGYEVVKSYNETGWNHHLNNRYENLIHYLNI